MASERQINANRDNAGKSTGPRTAAGKLISRRNALSHGLSARQLVVEDESPGQMELVIAGVIEELCPQTMLEAQLAEQIAHLTWRMRRIPAFESAIFAWIGQLTGMILPRPSILQEPACIVAPGRRKGITRLRNERSSRSAAWWLRDWART
jgi:hypothetical protein